MATTQNSPATGRATTGCTAADGSALSRSQSGDFATSTKRWWALVILAFGLGMIVLDGTIVGVSLPTMIRELQLDIVGAQWITTIYSVVFAALLLRRVRSPAAHRRSGGR